MQEIFTQFSTALLLGALIGAERERMQQKKHFEDFAGIRSFIFICLLGYATAFLSKGIINEWISVISYTLFFLLIISSYLYNSFIKHHEGITTELAAILTFLTGYLVYVKTPLAVVLGIFIVLILTLKDFSHKILGRLKNAEFYAALKFAVIAFLVLPLLPKAAIDPWGIFKPYSLWLTVVLISGVSFLGYILTRLIGIEKSARYTGFFGGISSSTAVNLAFSEESKIIGKNTSGLYSLASGVLLATGVSFSRILFAIYITNPDFFLHVWIPVCGIALTLIIASLITRWVFHRKKHILSEFKIDSPFSLKSALEFGLLLMLILVMTEAGRHYLGNTGIYITALFSGMVKGDAIAIAIATLVLKKEISMAIATKALLVSISGSFLSKWIFSRIIGTKEYSRLFGFGLIAPFIMGIMLLLYY